MKEDWKGIGQPTYEKVNEELFLDNIESSKLAYRIYVILSANKEFKKRFILTHSENWT
jgi:hypothetical protein